MLPSPMAELSLVQARRDIAERLGRDHHQIHLYIEMVGTTYYKKGLEIYDEFISK